MINIPIWLFVVMSFLSVLFGITLILIIFCFIKIKAHNEKEWQKLLEDTYKMNNWEDKEK